MHNIDDHWASLQPHQVHQQRTGCVAACACAGIRERMQRRCQSMDNEVDLEKLQMILGVLGCPHLRLMGSRRVHGPTGPLLAAPAFSDVQATFNREHAYARLGALLKPPSSRIMRHWAFNPRFHQLLSAQRAVWPAHGLPHPAPSHLHHSSSCELLCPCFNRRLRAHGHASGPHA
jgi:hypothetical protein